MKEGKKGIMTNINVKKKKSEMLLGQVALQKFLIDSWVFGC